MQPSSLSTIPAGGEQASVEAERDHYRQQYSNMVLIVKELHQQLAQYKLRCAGVDTFAVILKEAKQESVSLSRQKKVLETAITNLQNRLSTHGLSSSVNIEETEMYVPGTSKQTLENLARENARLRSLLKSDEYQSVKRPFDDVQDVKALLDDSQREKDHLKAQLKDMTERVQQYEATIISLKNTLAEEQAARSQTGFETYKSPLLTSSKNSDKDSDKEYPSDDSKIHRGSQSSKLHTEMVNNFKRSLRSLMDQCVHLEDGLDNIFTAQETRDEGDGAGVQKGPIVTEEEYQAMRQRISEITTMNQRWQVHNDFQESHHIAALAELKNETDLWKQEAEHCKAEYEKLYRQMEEQRQKSGQVDPSYVEILKQQIQVCTEDFNNERKDHQQVLAKNKSLQAEVDTLKAEVEKKKQELHELRLKGTVTTPPQQTFRQSPDQQAWRQLQQQSGQPRGNVGSDIPLFPPVRYLNRPNTDAPGSGNTGQHMAWPRHTESGIIASGGSGCSGNTGPHTAWPRHTESGIIAGGGSGWSQGRQFVLEGDGGSSEHYRLPITNEMIGRQQPMTLPDFPSNRPPPLSHSQSDLNFHTESGGSTPKGAINTAASMPAPRRQSEDGGAYKGSGVMSCPKCSKEFPEDQTKALLSHIDACND